MQIDIKRWGAELTDKLLGVYGGGLLFVGLQGS